jgi:translation initiation factor IF-1
MGKKKVDTVKGLVIEALPNSQFTIELEDGTEVRAYLAGKMKHNRIRVLIGDQVELVMDTYGDNHRLVTRL